MARDMRQVVAAILTCSMLMMLCNMIKRDHIDPLIVENLSVQFDVIKVSKQGVVKLSDTSDTLWRTNYSLKPCWRKPMTTNEEEQSKGYIFFTLAESPEYHFSQITDAVVVARNLGATLVLPEIRGSKTGYKRRFGDVYDIKRFMTSLRGIVQVVKDPPIEASTMNITNLRVPSMVTKDFVASKIEPIFKSKRHIWLSTKLPSSTMATNSNAKEAQSEVMNPYGCLTMFETLDLQQELKQLVSSMVGTLRSLSHERGGRFVAVDLKVESLGKKMCQGTTNGTKSSHCYNAKEIGVFLKKIGFGRATTIYLTQNGWHESLDALRNIFPNTFTKDAIIPAYEKAKYHITKNSEIDKVIDFQICTQADVFVPSISDMFYTSVVAKRIATGKTQILVPSLRASNSSTAMDYVSPYISNKSHLAYSCFCS